MKQLMAGCLLPTECQTKRPEPNPDVSATTTDRKHHQKKRKRPQAEWQDNNEPKATQTAEPNIRTKNANLLTRYASKQSGQDSRPKPKPNKAKVKTELQLRNESPVQTQKTVRHYQSRRRQTVIGNLHLRKPNVTVRGALLTKA